MIRAGILATASTLGGTCLTTAEVVGRTALGPQAAPVAEAKTGIRTRWWLDRDARVADVAVATVRAALENAGLGPSDLRRVIFVCSTGGDFLIPATANAVLDGLEVADSCDGFDLNNACMGFLSGLDVAARSVATGLAPVAVVSVERLSRFLDQADPRPWLVLADAAGAAIVGEARGEEGILSCVLGNDGAHRGSVFMAHPGLTDRRETIRFADSNRDMTEGALGALEGAALRALRGCGLGVRDMDFAVVHQPNGSMTRKVLERLGIPEDRVAPVAIDAGSVGSASIAVGLDRLMRSGRVRAGHRVLMAGVGAGLSYGALVWQVGG